jgi:hypothetical protein
MRRLLFAGAILGTFLLLPARAGAQTTPPTPTPPLAPTAFALTQPSFPPPGHVFASQVETNDAAAGDQRVLHVATTSFAQENRVTGYFMDVGQANYDTKGVPHPVYTRYLVSIFNSVDDATAAFTDERDAWNGLLNDPTSSVNGKIADLAGQQFGDMQAPGLYEASASTSQGDADLTDLLFKRGPYVFEVWQTALHTDAATYGAGALPFLYSVAKTLDATAAGTPLAAPPPAPADFSILAARFEPNHQEQDLTKPAISSATAGSSVQMTVYVVVRSAGGSSGAKTTFKLAQGKRSMHQSHTFSLGSTLADYYGFTLYDVQLPRSGTYTFTATIKIGKVSKHATVKIKVSGGKKRVAVTLGGTPAERVAPAWTVREPTLFAQGIR